MKHFKIFTSILCLPLLFSFSLNKNNDSVSSVAYSQRRLEKYQQEALVLINSVDLDLYRTSEANEITELISQTSSRISNSNDFDEIDAIVSSFNRYVLTVKTDAELTKEEQEAQTTEEGVYYISSLSELLEFRDDVNAGYNYLGETIKLTQDIVIPSGQSFGEPIGKTQANCFSGIFDGQNHKITNLKLSSTACAFIYFGTNCTVKNLSFENVDITASTFRAAAVISRAESITIDNVHVLSGTINGTKQNGGLVGTIVGGSTKSVIKNSSNAASVSSATIGSTSAGVGTGGAVGYLYSGTVEVENVTNSGTITSTTEGVGGVFGYVGLNSYKVGDDTYYYSNDLTIKNCVNDGNVTGAGNGTGGIFGASTDSTKGGVKYTTIKVDNCTNNGAISGVGYAGGISGLIRYSTTASYIANCKNFGNVTASSTACGGITGAARVDLYSCGCYHACTLKVSSTTKLASAASETGSPGYITIGYQTGCNTHTNNILINLDGTAYN